MQFELIGWSHYGFTNDQGKYVEGYKFHVARPSSSANFHGHEVASISVSEQIVQKCGEPQVDAVYDVSYDPKGRIASYKLHHVPGQTKIPNT